MPLYETSWRLYNLIDGEVVRLPLSNPLPPLPSIDRLLLVDYPFPRHIPSNSDMSQPSSSSTFQALFNTALQNYKDKTGSSLVDHPFAHQFQECDSVESITTILEEQARMIFRESRDHGQLVNSLKRLVKVLCSPFFTTVLDKGIGPLVCLKSIRPCTLLLIVIPQPFPPAKAIFAGIAILLAVNLILLVPF